LQKRVLPTLHYALNVPGYLVLGTSETVGENGDLFEPVDRANKIYLKKPTAARAHVHFIPDAFPSPSRSSEDAARATPTPIDFQREADRILLGRYAPPGVLVNENFDILQFRGRTSAYLEPLPGEPTNNVLKMAREGLFLELRSALTAAAKENQPVQAQGIKVRGDGGVRILDLEIIPVKPPGMAHACFLILFNEAAARDDKGSPLTAAEEPRASGAAMETADPQEFLQLRRELAATKEYLQSLVEEQDAANEELRSANEEILSSNEELQSTNEELETAKEELQSTNEELTTVNEQLQQRNLELTQSTDDLTNLLTSAAIPVVMVGADLRIRRFTSAAKQIMNLDSADVGRPIAGLKMNVDLPDLGPLVEEVIEQVQMREREVRSSDGRWHMLRIHPYRTAGNKIEGAVIVLLDIDDIKQAVKNLQQQSELLALTHEAIFAYKPDGPVVYWNRGASELYGYTADEAVGRNSHELVGTDKQVAAAFEQELQRRGHWVGELIHRTRDGRQVVVESRQQIVSRSDGSQIVLETNRDITDRKQLEEELSRRLDQLKEADQHKDEFLATLAHELRNPLAPVLNVVELLRLKDLPEEEEVWCRDILERQIKQMGRMLDDLLDLGRITGNKFELQKQPMNLADAIQTAIEMSGPYFDAARHQFTLKLSSEPLMVEADPTRIAQIFSNLLNNAAKYTPAGGEISVTMERGNGEALVSIKDTGVGIPAELLPVIFDMFVQEKHSMGDQPSGLGIGLALVRKLVELHGGTIEARSGGRGQGSEFILHLPLANGEPAARAEAPPAQPRRSDIAKRILVVDDREDQMRSMRTLLARMGHEVHVAQSGERALAALAEFPAEFALIDIGLEGMDGYELARRIRQRPELQHIILVAQTGWGRDEDRRRSHEAGFDHHLVKPISRESLEQILQNPEKKS
jgi:two-component system CheB/CheR fusion protein